MLADSHLLERLSLSTTKEKIHIINRKSYTPREKTMLTLALLVAITDFLVPSSLFYLGEAKGGGHMPTSRGLYLPKT